MVLGMALQHSSSQGSKAAQPFPGYRWWGAGLGEIEGTWSFKHAAPRAVLSPKVLRTCTGSCLPLWGWNGGGAENLGAHGHALAVAR